MRTVGPGKTGALACVLGDADLLRALGLAGIPCAVAAEPGSPPRYSRFARVVLDWADAWEQPVELLELLERFAAGQREPPVLFYEEDRDLLLLSRHRERLRRHFRFVMPEAALVEKLVDKCRFQALAQRLDLPVPPARALDPRTEPVGFRWRSSRWCAGATGGTGLAQGPRRCGSRRRSRSSLSGRALRPQPSPCCCSS